MRSVAEGEGERVAREATHRVRRAVPLAAVLVAGFLSAQILVGAGQIGISNDEAVHEARMSTWFETRWYLPMRFLDERTNEPATEFRGRVHTYGAAYSLIAHGLNVATGAERPGHPSRDSRAYVGRSVTIALLGIATAAAVAYALLVTTGSVTIGLWAGAALLAIPTWSGYSMFAVKDIPSASGWTLLTAGLTVALVAGPDRRRPVAVGLLCMAGVWFSFGVRFALWVIVATSLATFTVLALASNERARLRSNVLAVAAGTVTGFTAVMAAHPKNAATPLRWLVGAVESSQDFGWTGATLTAGQLVTEKPPWWYLPSWVFGSLPLVLGLLALGGLALATYHLLPGTRRGTVWRARLGDRQSSSVLWAHQMLLVPAGAVITNATMYGGMRQHLYVLPAMAGLAGFAAWRLARSTLRSRTAVTAALLLVAALAIPTIEQTRLFPYNYVYKNPIAGPVNDRWETDMHWTSRREALMRVPADVDAYFYTQATRMLSGDVRRRGLRVVDESRALGPFVHEHGAQAAQQDVGDRIWVIARRYRGSPPNPGCVEQDNVTRRLRGEEVIISYVLLCDPAMAPDPDGSAHTP